VELINGIEVVVMGAWGTGSFANDGAADLVGELGEDGGLDEIEAALDAVLDVGDDYLEAPAAEAGIAAADIVARLLDRDGDHPPAEADLEVWLQSVEGRPPRSLVAKARRCIRRVVTKPSEILELWAETDELDDWKANLRSIAERLS